MFLERIPRDKADDRLDARWDIDFSLSLFNRTGKYFIGRDIIDRNRDVVASIAYWRLKSTWMPRGLVARVIGRLEAIERDFRARHDLTKCRAPHGRRRWLHLDPLTVVHRHLTREDVVLCHDLGPITHPHLFAPGVCEVYSLAFRLIAEVQPHVVFVSKASKDAMARLYGPMHETSVVYPHIRTDAMSGELSAPELVRTPFLLTVGSIGARKNQAAALRAFQLSGLADRGYSYVLCGPREPGCEEAMQIAGQVPGAIILPYVSDENLRWLYANATAFVLPSLLEGFGMPVAEAIAAGLVPVVSQTSVLEEVAGPGCVAVDPGSVESIRAGLVEAAGMGADERATRLAVMQNHAQAFSKEAFDRNWRAVLTTPRMPSAQALSRNLLPEAIT